MRLFLTWTIQPSGIISEKKKKTLFRAHSSTPTNFTTSIRQLTPTFLLLYLFIVKETHDEITSILSIPLMQYLILRTPIVWQTMRRIDSML